MEVFAASFELDSLEDSDDINESLEEVCCELEMLERRLEVPVSDDSDIAASAPVFVFCSTSRKKPLRQFDPSPWEVCHN